MARLPQSIAVGIHRGTRTTRIFRRRSLSFISSRNFSSSLSEEVGGATIVQGPSLLINTGHARPSPSLFFLPGLRSIPFWTAPPDKETKTRVAYNDPTVSSVVKHLEDHVEEIRDEYMAAVMGSSQRSQFSLEENQTQPSSPMEPDYGGSGTEHDKSQLHEGTWDWHSYIQNGQRKSVFSERCPTTAKVVDDLGEHLFASSNCGGGHNPFAYCFYSTLQGGSRIRAHTGPMNLRLRIHLPLLVPSKQTGAGGDYSCGIRVGDQARPWVNGRALVLDDCYDHEVWNDTEEARVLLLVDIWHPDVADEERRRIMQMFQYARTQGWISGNKIK